MKTSRLIKNFQIKSVSSLTTLLALTLLFSCTGGGKGGSSEHGKKNELHINIGAEPAGINPITSTDGYSTYVKEYTLDSLLYRDPDTLKWEPGVAESYEVSKDGMTYTFKIKKGLTFHDGSPLTADDVKVAFDAVFDDEYAAFASRPYFSLIEKCEVLDPFTVRFKTKEKYFLNFDVVAGISPIPSKFYKNAKEGKKINLNIYGSGPYKLESFERGKKIVLTKFNDWWGFKAGNPKKEYLFDKIHMYFVDDDTVQLENFKKGKFDVLLPPIQPEIFVKQMVGPEWGTKLIKVKAENKTPKGYSYVGFNLRSPKFKDVRVRKALNHLMNREWMIKTFFYEMYDRANGPVDIAGNDNDTTYAPYAFDVDKAKALLKAAGWEDKNKDGILEKMIDGKKEEMRFTILIATDTWQKWLTIYKEDAAKAGIEVNIQLVEWNSFLKLIDEAKFDAMAMAWGGGSPDMDFKQIWHSESAVKGGSNRINYSNSAVDKMIEEHRRILDSKTRQVLSHKIFRAIADDAPYIFMFSRKFDPYTHNARIQKPKDTFTYSIGKTYWSVAQ